MSSILKIALGVVVLAALGTVGFFSLRGGHKADTTFIRTLQLRVVPHSSYVIDLPSNYSLEENTGPDFSVFYIKPVDTAATRDFYGGFYLGHYQMIPALMRRYRDRYSTPRKNGLYSIAQMVFLSKLSALQTPRTAGIPTCMHLVMVLTMRL